MRGESDTLDIATAVQPPAGTRTVYISYSWGDDSSKEARQRGQVVDNLCAVLGSKGWNVVRDRSAMRYGGLITDFMKTITRADRIIAVISEKYLRSAFCMTELHGIYARSMGEKQDFLQRIIPLTLDDVKLSDWHDRAKVTEYWGAQLKEMEKHLPDLGTVDFALYKAMRNWHNHAGDILAHVSDVLHPHGFDSIVKDDFAGLIQMLEG